MAESKKHRETAERIARNEGVKYNPSKGADVISKRRAIEVETVNTVSGGMQQLQGHRKPVYIAGTDERTIKAALKKTQGTTVGVMDNQGKVIRRSTRGKKK